MTANTASALADMEGEIHLPGTAGYDAGRSGYNLLVEHRPAMVVVPNSVRDVMRAVAHARHQGLPVAIQATGHGPTVAADGAVLINTQRMQSVCIDPDRQTATFEAGVTSGTVVQAAADHGLAPVNGSSPDVGAVSYHLGRGLGILSREFGYASDRVEAMDVVTADGTLHHVSPTREPDLFWALLHAKGNFGVVVSMTVRLVPMRRLYGGGLWFGEGDIGPVLAAWARWTESVPNELSTSALLIDLPDLGLIPEPIRGRRTLHLRIAFTGTAARGEVLVGDLRTVGRPLLDTVAEIPYREVATIHDEPTHPVAFCADHTILRGLDDVAVRLLLDHAHATSPAPYLVELRLLGGAMGHGANSTRGEFTCYVGGPVAPDTHGSVRSSQQAVIDALEPWSTGEVCENFLSGPHVSADRLSAGRTVEEWVRLRQVKERFDPANLFRVNLNIDPTGEPRFARGA